MMVSSFGAVARYLYTFRGNDEYLIGDGDGRFPVNEGFSGARDSEGLESTNLEDERLK